MSKRSSTAPSRRRSSAARRGGGGATAGGVTFQARVAAWFGAMVLAEAHAARLPGLAPDAVAEEVWCETTEALDDVEVRTSAGIRLQVQAKRTLALTTSQTGEFAKVCTQLVDAAARGEPGDILVLAVGPGAGTPVTRDLRELLDALRLQPAAAPFRRDRLSQAKANVQEKLLAHLRRSWRASHGAIPKTADLRELLRCTYVLVLDVEADGTEARAAEGLLRQAVLATAADGPAAWTTLTLVFADLARQRSGTDRTGLQAALAAAGIAVQAPPSVRPSIEALRRHTEATAAQLGGLSRIELVGGSVTIDREVANVLQATSSSGSVLVVGEPGIGKSGALNELAAREQAAGSDLVALQVEELEAASQHTLARELGLERDVADVISAWPGGRGVLIVDGLDAARSDHTRAALVEAIRRVLERAPRWRVVASIRTFDLRYDPVLQRQFPAREGAPAGTEWLDPEFRSVAHVRVGRLSQGEIGQLHATAPALHDFVSSAPEAMRELARVPFNLRLVADLLASARMPESELRNIDTQVGLLKAYWRERVLRPPAQADARERLLHRLCEAMIAGRRLTLPRAELRAGDVDLTPLHPLLHDHVLVERSLPGGEATRERIGFAHNVLFDYAVARLLLSAPGSLAQLLQDDPSLVLRIRPSIEFHMREQWNADAERTVFWDEALELAEATGLRELARTVGPAVAAERAREAEDLSPLLHALDTGSAAAENAAQHVVGALMAFAEPEDLVRRAPWPAFAAALAERLTPGRAGVTRALLATLLDHRSVAAPDALAAAGAAAREFLRRAWDARLDSMAEFGIDAVRQTFATAPQESEALLRRVLDATRIPEHGYRELPRLTRDIEELVPHSPAFVADMYRAAFSYRESSEEKTPMVQSSLLPMTSTKRQDYEMSHYALEQAFPAFLQQAPAEAVDALDAVVDGYVAWRSLEHERTVVRFRIGDRTCGIRADTSYIWASGAAHHEEERMVGALARALEADSDVADALASAITTGTRNAALWARLLIAAAQRPERFAQQLGEVLRKTALYTMTDVRHPMAVALAALHPLLDDASRAAAENAVLKIPRGAPPDARERREELRDGLLASLDAKLLVVPMARRRLAEINARGQGPAAPQPPFALTGSWRSVTPAEIVAEQGVDPTRVPNAKLLELAEPVREFAERYANEIPDTATRKAILAPIKRLWSALTSDINRDADPPVRDRAWGHAVEAAAILAHTPATLTAAAGRVVTEILLAAATHRLPTARAAELERFDELPSWGFPAPRIYAAEGLTVIGQEARWTTPEVLASVVTLSRDPSPQSGSRSRAASTRWRSPPLTLPG